MFTVAVPRPPEARSAIRLAEHLDYLFRKSKMVIIDQIKQGVEIFDQTCPTCIATDLSGRTQVLAIPETL